MAYLLSTDVIDAICVHVHAMDVGRFRLVCTEWRAGMGRACLLVPSEHRVRTLAMYNYRCTTTFDELQLAWQAVATTAERLLEMLEMAARLEYDGALAVAQIVVAHTHGAQSRRPSVVKSRARWVHRKRPTAVWVHQVWCPDDLAARWHAVRTLGRCQGWATGCNPCRTESLVSRRLAPRGRGGRAPRARSW